MKTEHSISSNKHRIEIDGLRVWIFKDSSQWIAQGIDIDYAVAGETPEQVQELFSVALMMTLVENIRRFGSIDRFISKRAPKDIEDCWQRALDQHLLNVRITDLHVPVSELGAPQEKFGVPSKVTYYQEAA